MIFNKYSSIFLINSASYFCFSISFLIYFFRSSSVFTSVCCGNSFLILSSVNSGKTTCFISFTVILIFVGVCSCFLLWNVAGKSFSL